MEACSAHDHHCNTSPGNVQHHDNEAFLNLAHNPWKPPRTSDNHPTVNHATTIATTDQRFLHRSSVITVPTAVAHSHHLSHGSLHESVTGEKRREPLHFTSLENGSSRRRCTFVAKV
ncbi:hypothetical protein DEO72_LG2g3360 [Vigna unguiculata]|uniref:Uncharacterized protein n=1 Tax=Vigna unguiculata TaxID=3917 RepID=A0A4D6L3G8_VIGUN|nr:hypothetical protein DEO72_LG2g3360 [Vigna unguiculata]